MCVALGLCVLAVNSRRCHSDQDKGNAKQGHTQQDGVPQDRRTRMGMALEVQRAELNQQKLCCCWGLLELTVFSWVTYKQSFIAHSWEGWKLKIKVSVESVTLPLIYVLCVCAQRRVKTAPFSSFRQAPIQS